MDIQTLNSFSLLFEMTDDGSQLLHVIKTAKTILRDADTGQNLAPPKLEAVALTQEEAATLLGDRVAALTTQIESLTTERDANIAELSTKAEALTAAEQQVTSLQAQVASLQEQLAAAQSPTQNDPTVVTDLQARLALAQANKLDAIDAYIQTLPASNAARIFYERALTWRRDNAHLIALAQRFGMTDTDIDQLFARAKTLN